MPQIDKVLFLPQVLGSFIIIILFFIFLIKFASLSLASIFNARYKLADLSIIQFLQNLRKAYKTKSIFIINSSFLLKQKLLSLNFRF